jgi:EAL domain-containing protein (putative c-di-GMP-specific phosphodiesterase class I)
MDDFGTGYSSLNYLRIFPFDKIKIDRTFVHELSTAAGDGLAIVKAVIGLGRSLGISTAAEGVETEAQLDLVRAQGCSEVQGFFLSPPLPAAAVSRLFAGGPGFASMAANLKVAS